MITENQPGDGFTTRRVWRDRPDIARRHLRRKYGEGVQIAFEYFENEQTTREGLQRFFRWLDQEEPTS